MFFSAKIEQAKIDSDMLDLVEDEEGFEDLLNSYKVTDRKGFLLSLKKLVR